MRGVNSPQHAMFSSFSPEDRVPAAHPLRAMTWSAERHWPNCRGPLRSCIAPWDGPRSSPERLLKCQILIALDSVRSDELFCERLDDNILFRWFLDRNVEEASFDPTTFTKNRERLLAHQIARQFFDAVVGQARAAGLCEWHTD